MAQNDFVIADANATTTKTDLNSAYQALASQNSGATAPATTYANMIWYDTATNILKMRNEADSAWLNLGYIDQTDGQEVFDDTKVVNTSGTQTGVIGDQSTATWETATGTTESLVSPAKVKAAIVAAVSPVYEFVESIALSGGQFTTSDFEAGYSYRLICTDLSVSGGAARFMVIHVQKTSDSSWVGNTTDTASDNIFTGIGLGSGDSVSAIIDIHEPGLSANTHVISFMSTQEAYTAGSDGFGTSHTGEKSRVISCGFLSATTIKAVRLHSRSSNFGSGVVRVYRSTTTLT